MTVKLEEFIELTAYNKQGAVVIAREEYSPLFDVTERVEEILAFNPEFTVRVALVRKDVMVFKSTAFGVTVSE